LIAVALVALLVVALVGALALIRLSAHGPGPLTVAQVVKLVQPSVVAVSVTPFRSDAREGSGFVYGSPQRILTSAHLVARALSVSVMDSSGETYAASVIGVDRQTDVAELQVNSIHAKPIAPAKGAQVVGSRVLVIDSPVGFLTHDVTQGLISGTGRDLTIGTATYRNLIQTGAVASAGDTGGPLVDGEGHLVGIVTADDTGHAFAIPVASFSSDARTWAKSSTPIDLGPPLVKASARSLVLPSIGPGWTPRANDQWDSTTWHIAWDKPPTYVYGGEGVDIYLDVELNQVGAIASYQHELDYLRTNGFTMAGAIEGLGDAAIAYQKVVGGKPTFAVTWRDRNSEAVVYLASGTSPRPEATMSTTLAIAFAQGSAIDADLANYS
jgi:hypothetical protein